VTKLTDKQKAFVEEYLVDLNATQAAIRAGYSEHTAQMIGSENLSKPMIQGAIQAGMDARTKRTRLEADTILNEIAGIGFDQEEKTNDRLKALELLGRHKILFSDKIVHDGAVQITRVERAIVNPDATNS